MGGDWQRICDPDGVSPRNLCVGLQTSPGLSQALGWDPGGESGDRVAVRR